jgi:hypothetical protein
MKPPHIKIDLAIGRDNDQIETGAVFLRPSAGLNAVLGILTSLTFLGKLNKVFEYIHLSIGKSYKHVRSKKD